MSLEKIGQPILFNTTGYEGTATAKSLQSCPTLCDPMDCSLSGSSTHGIFQAIPFSMGFSSGSPLPSPGYEGKTVVIV